MAGYDAGAFAKDFAKRTHRNFEYIDKTVHSRDYEIQCQENFLKRYNNVLAESNQMVAELRCEANNISSVRTKGKGALKSEIFSIATKLENSHKKLTDELKNIYDFKISSSKDADLYEITQLVNSMLGIVVLPYEMFKDTVFKNKANKKDKWELYNRITNCEEYIDLKNEIIGLYKAGKWMSSYKSDYKEEELNETYLVFNFLEHLRNAACHCGDEAMGILPLDEGKEIDHIIFYDTPPTDKGVIDANKSEFAMKLTIEEVKALVGKIIAFYEKSELGIINKTEQLKKAEKRVNDLLNEEKNRKGIHE